MSRVSVIIPTYNRSGLLSNAIESALKQTISPFEIIVVDDSSTDQTQKIASKYDDQVTYVRHLENRGGAAARNTGISVSSGDYLAFLDSDDRWMPKKLEIQISDIESRNENFVASYCNVDHKKRGVTGKIRELLGDSTLNYRRSGYEGGEELIEKILMTEFKLGGSSTLLADRDAVLEVSGFDDSFPRHQDWEFLIRLLKIGKIAHVDQPLVQKVDTGYPEFGTTLVAKKKLFEKFDNEVRKVEQNGGEIYGEHYRGLAKIAFREGKYIHGIKCLRNANIHTVGHALELGYSGFYGLNNYK